jgi:DNA invertase Pin-like site-specific DNA recombinase
MGVRNKPRKRLIGCARVSTQQQDLARQIQALKRLGCSAIYSDTASGKSMAGRPELARALDDLDTGDELVIAEWDRSTHSMWDGLQIIKAVIDAGASIKVLDRSYIDLATPMGRGFMAMMSAMAEDEHLRIIGASTKDGKLRARRASAWAASRSLPPPDQGGPPAACRGRADAQPCQELRRQHQHDFKTDRIALIGMSRLSAFRRQALEFLTRFFVSVRHVWVRLITGLFVSILAVFFTYTGYNKWRDTITETIFVVLPHVTFKNIFGTYS